MFVGQGLVWQQILRHLGDKGGSNAASSPVATPSISLDDSASQLRECLLTLADGENTQPAAASSSQPRSSKRRRTSHGGNQAVAPSQEGALCVPDHDRMLPPADLVDSLVEIYFERIHPWIPILHLRKFRQAMADPERRHELSTILHAIVSLCVRFSEDSRVGDSETKASISKGHREVVILQSMESFSVKNLQALIICAFDTVSGV